MSTGVLPPGTTSSPDASRTAPRPVASPDDDKVIVSACESTPYRIATGVQRQDRFWIKSQPYSLQDMLANDDSVDQFVGGTVYQAYLTRDELSPLAQPGGRDDCQGVRPAGHLLLRGRFGGLGRRRSPRLHSLPGACRGAGDHPHRSRRSRHWPGGVRGGRHGRSVLLHDRTRRHAWLPRRKRRGTRVLPVRRLDLLSRLSPRRDRRLQPCGPSPTAQPSTRRKFLSARKLAVANAAV